MHWIIQNNILNEEGHSDLTRDLETLEIPHSVHKIIPFTTELSPQPEIQDDRVVCIGSYTMLRIARANKWSPGAFDLQEFTHLDLREKWGDRMLNQGTQTTFEKVPETKEFQAGQFFLRPATDEKFFVGAAFDKDTFLAWWEKIVTLKEDYGNGLTPQTPVLISELKTIHSEYRTWIVNGKVVTASSYKLAGKFHINLPVDDDIFAFAEECAAVWSPEVAYCLDVGRTPEGLSIIEPNTINFAGFYKANVSKIIQAIENL